MRVTKRQEPGLDTGLKAPLEGAACAVSCSPRHEVDDFVAGAALRGVTTVVSDRFSRLQCAPV